MEVDDGTDDLDPAPVAFECPPGYRKVAMANGGSTCVPLNMVRPRVGPYTPTVDVSALAGRTPYRPGQRRAAYELLSGVRKT